jgi:hypothetical protein
VQQVQVAGEGAAEALRDSLGLRRRATGQQSDELVSAEARDEILGSEDVVHPLAAICRS